MALVHRVGWQPHFFEQSPWFWPIAPVAQRFAEYADWPLHADFNAVHSRILEDQGLLPFVFRENVRKQDKRDNDGRIALHALYDARVSQAREVPTRERDWHDLLNMLCFTTFPRSKHALHSRIHAITLARVEPNAKRLPNRRTPEQDALALFDEGGVVLAATADAAQQLRASTSIEQSNALCQALVNAQQLRIMPFGHALFEHEVEGLRVPGGCTQIVCVPDDRLWREPPDFLRQLDISLSAHLRDPEHFQSPRSCGQVLLSALEL